jgi:hypothetical protein
VYIASDARHPLRVNLSSSPTLQTSAAMVMLLCALRNRHGHVYHLCSKMTALNWN